MANRTPPRKATKVSGLYKPKLLVVAFALFWAGTNQPESLTPTTLVLWVLSAVTAGVLMRAALVVAEPLVKLVLKMARQAGIESGAEEP